MSWARARIVGLCGLRGCSVSRCVSSSSRWRAASVGSSLARLGVQASRDRASVRGLSGKRTSKSSLRKAETRGPLVSSRPMATGWPLNRVRSVVTHASMASGVCSSWQYARFAEPAAWRHPACVASAQSIPRKAAKASCDPCVMRHLPACARVARRDRPADVLRRHEREPVARQILSVRSRTPAHLRSRGYVRKHHVLVRACSSSAGAGSCFPCQLPARCGQYH
jgi:hypothetical protein